MLTLRTILGTLLGAAVNLAVCRIIPFTPDLTDWGGRAYPRSYLVPLLILAVISYASGWLAARVSPKTGRLAGMLAGIVVAVIVILWDINVPLLAPLFHHPAYPIFSDHALLALAVLLVGSHLGGTRVER
ncbi:unnamed protein product, partial [marine sediment metagenome]